MKLSPEDEENSRAVTEGGNSAKLELNLMVLSRLFNKLSKILNIFKTVYFLENAQLFDNRSLVDSDSFT